MKIDWSPQARALARRYLADQDGMRAIGAAVAVPPLWPDRDRPQQATLVTGDQRLAHAPGPRCPIEIFQPVQ